jgi:cytochrome c-type biogenesis protein CcmF
VAALLSVLGGSAAYVVSEITSGQKSDTFREWGRHGFRMAALMTGLASIYLMSFFVNRHYEVDYVFHNSSRDLPLIFRVSSFWAGQEGSFLLWGMWTGVLGLILYRKAGKDEASVMPFYGLTYAFILAMVAMINPFKVSAAPRLDGNGLNPLLQDYWMAIHPPTLFLGYALMAVPFAFAMGALWRKDYRDWIRAAAPWAIMGATVLALALSMGGHWAYRTLGWGGFWGWDPVENASFVPMLCGIALLHGLYLQRGANAAGQRMNIGLAITGFIAVMYASYLTRSGVLTQFSNHSFSEMKHSWFLLASLLFFVFLGSVWYLARFARIPAPKLYDSLSSREFGFYLSVVVTMIAAVMVAVGTSTPIITGWFAKKPYSAPPAFYNWTMAPIGFLMALMVAVYPLAARNGISVADLRRRIAIPLIAGLLASAAALLAARGIPGLQPPQIVAATGLAFGGVLAATLNVMLLVRVIRTGGVASSGGYLAHIGFGVLLVGVVCSSVYSTTRRLTVAMGKPAFADGYSFQLLDRGESPNPQKVVIPLRVTGASQPGRAFEVRPFMSQDRNGMQMTSPGIHSNWHHDLYVAPVQFDPGGLQTMPITLKRGQIYVFGPLKLYFAGVDQIGQPGSPDFGMRANLLAIRGKVHAPVSPEINFQTSRGTIVGLPGGSRINISPDNDFQNGVVFDLAGPNSTMTAAYAIVDVTVKPLIWLTWLGMVTTVAGGLISVRRRAKDRKRVVETAVLIERPAEHAVLSNLH